MIVKVYTLSRSSNGRTGAAAAALHGLLTQLGAPRRRTLRPGASSPPQVSLSHVSLSHTKRREQGTGQCACPASDPQGRISNLAANSRCYNCY